MGDKKALYEVSTNGLNIKKKVLRKVDLAKTKGALKILIILQYE